MLQRVLLGGSLAILAVVAVSGQGPSTSAPRGATADRQRAAAPVDAAAQRALIDKYCVGCHSTRVKAGGLALDQLDLSRLADHADVARRSP